MLMFENGKSADECTYMIIENEQSSELIDDQEKSKLKNYRFRRIKTCLMKEVRSCQRSKSLGISNDIGHGLQGICRNSEAGPIYFKPMDEPALMPTTREPQNLALSINNAMQRGYVVP